MAEPRKTTFTEPKIGGILKETSPSIGKSKHCICKGSCAGGAIIFIARQRAIWQPAVCLRFPIGGKEGK